MRDAREAFERTHGAPPAGVWSAPGRVNLIGEHTDYNGGLALPVALPQRTYAACSPRADDLLRVRSLQSDTPAEVRLTDVGPGTPGGWAAYVAGVLWALREAGHEVRGMDVVVDGRVPLGGGLSSSAALECSVGAAASDLFGLGLLDDDAGRSLLVDACRRAENDVAGAPTGGMDQSASLLCREGHALLLDCRDDTHEHVPVRLAANGLVLLVTDTRAQHELVDGQYGERRAACERAAAELGVETLREVPAGELEDRLAALSDDELRRRTRHVVTEIVRVQDCVAALRAEDFGEVGRLFVASHESLRADYEVSAPELDLVVDSALGAGALGARMTGGGFGGSAISLVRAPDAEAVTEAVTAAFTDQGYAVPATFACTPSSAAHRDA
ncbi:MAG TPA: galactokinase [Dermatophilaceae bacterium]|nr:galactokinase [Dermatophilaceae bacterium]